LCIVQIDMNKAAVTSVMQQAIVVVGRAEMQPS